MDYLGFDLDRETIDAVPADLDAGADPRGRGCSAPRRLYEEIEEKLIKPLGAEDSLLLPTISDIHLSVIPLLAASGIPDSTSHIISVQDPVPPMPGFVFANNLIQSPTFPTWSAGGGNTDCAASEVPVTIMQTCFGAGYVFSRNLLVGDFSKYPLTKWPAGQTFLASMDLVGFVDYAGGNYALSSSSPYRGTGRMARMWEPMLRASPQ